MKSRPSDPLHAILVTGDITDAGLATEWAEFFDALAQFPRVAAADAGDPGQSRHQCRQSRQSRRNSTCRPAQARSCASCGSCPRSMPFKGRAFTCSTGEAKRLDQTLVRALSPSMAGMVAFADTGRPRHYGALDDLWSNAFPMALPPDRDDGLGIILLNSNADTHFLFTNALGMVSADQFSAAAAIMTQYPRAGWVVCIHHHVVEYPRPDVALSERIGTALINGQWFVRRLQPFADRIVVMHGHRHFDWFGRCGAFP